MEIRLGFDPWNLTVENDDPEKMQLQSLFDIGGVPLRFWALFKKDHIVGQDFLPGLLKLHEAIEDLNEKGYPVYDFDWFHDMVRRHCVDYTHSNFRNWLIKHWDYFNPNIQRKVSLFYKRIEPVEKHLSV